MLVNLDSDESMPPLQSGSVSPPAHGTASVMMDIHVADGEFHQLTLYSSFVSGRWVCVTSLSLIEVTFISGSL